MSHEQSKAFVAFLIMLVLWVSLAVTRDERKKKALLVATSLLLLCVYLSSSLFHVFVAWGIAR